jgi:hypothetical protein
VNQFDLPEGTNKVLRGKDWTPFGWANREIFRWIEHGGLFEDETPFGLPVMRSFNHFHNPLTNRGFAYAPWKTYSCKDWALMPVGRQVNESTVTDRSYSWFDARDYFYKSLTLAKKEEREEYFAAMFRAVGQVMHLIEDVSVPEHTRDDAHVEAAYESWVNSYANLNVSPIFFEELLQRGTALPLANLWDTNQYNGRNPSITTGAVGLAEFTNANFVSADTVGSFPYPKIEEASITTRHVQDPATGTPYEREYYVKGGDGPKGHLLCRVRRNQKWRNLPILSNLPQGPRWVFDENVYQEYSEILIPRAIGYATALFRYFFRGLIDVEVNQGKITITNRSNEDMNGKFDLYYDLNDRSRKIVPGASWSISLKAGASSMALSFTAPPDASEKFAVVFKGRLGKEPQAVAGKVFSVAKPYWAVVENYGARMRYPGIPISFLWDEETIASSKQDECPWYGALMNKITFNYECPGSSTPYTVWLVSSTTPLWNEERWPHPSCEDDLKMNSLGQFSQKEIFEKLQFMRYHGEIWWRKVSNYCDCSIWGDVVHRLHSKGIRIDEPWTVFTWAQHPQSDPNFVKIKEVFGISDNRVGSVFKAQDFQGDENVDKWYSNPIVYSSIWTNTAYPRGFYHPADVTYYDDEKVCVPRGSTETECFPIVGTIPANVPVATATGVVIEIR